MVFNSNIEKNKENNKNELKEITPKHISLKEKYNDIITDLNYSLVNFISKDIINYFDNCENIEGSIKLYIIEKPYEIYQKEIETVLITKDILQKKYKSYSMSYI